MSKRVEERVTVKEFWEFLDGQTVVPVVFSDESGVVFVQHRLAAHHAVAYIKDSDSRRAEYWVYREKDQSND